MMNRTNNILLLNGAQRISKQINVQDSCGLLYDPHKMLTIDTMTGIPLHRSLQSRISIGTYKTAVSRETTDDE